MTPRGDDMSEPKASDRPGRAEKLLISLAILGVLLLATWLLWPSGKPPPPPPPPVTPGPVAEPSPAPPPAPPEPEETAQDPRALLEGVSSNPVFRRWLGVGDLVRRWAVVTDNVAEGVSPRKQLELLDPGSPFSVQVRDGRSVIAAESYARYDGFGGAVASLDAQALAGVYRRLHPMLERTYRALGYPEASFDRVTARAIQRILAAPVRDGEVGVVEEDGLWLYEDPALERLPEVEKHLVRMGPRNTRLVQEKARELRDALGLPEDPAKER